MTSSQLAIPVEISSFATPPSETRRPQSCLRGRGGIPQARDMPAPDRDVASHEESTDQTFCEPGSAGSGHKSSECR